MAESQTKKTARSVGEKKRGTESASTAARRKRTQKAAQSAKETQKKVTGKASRPKGAPANKAKPTPKREKAPKKDTLPKQEKAPKNETSAEIEYTPRAELEYTLPVNTALNNSRNVWGVIFLLLSIFSALCWFDVEGLFIDFLRHTQRGLSGWGWWITPITMLLTSAQCFFHNGRPVRMRAFCALVIPVLLGTVVHILAGPMDIKLGLRAVADLWNMAGADYSGGVLGGFCAILLTNLFSRIGAFLVQMLLAGGIVMVLTRTTLQALLEQLHNLTKASKEAYENRPKLPFCFPKIPIPSYDDEEDEQQLLEQPAQTEKQAIKDYDVPMDEPVEQVPKEWEQPIREQDKERFQTVTRADTERSTQALPANAVTAEAQQSPFFQRDVSISTPDEYLKRETQDKVSQSVREPVTVGGGYDGYDDDDRFDSDEDGQLAIPMNTGVQKGNHTAVRTAKAAEGYQFPEIGLLNEQNSAPSAQKVEQELTSTEQELAETIQSFGIDGAIIGSTRGPSVTRYDLKLERGVKLSKITNLAKDIALSLGAVSVRIAPVTGKNSIVGIEVPNRLVSSVSIRSVIESKEFRESSFRLAFAVGKDIANHNIVGDISRMPHLLIAGTTGSGKSVCTNSMIISLLYKYSPEDVRLIMIDPKMVELSNYNGIPHLLIPVVVDPKKAAGALQWAVYEMMQRYQDFANQSVRDVESFNHLVKEHKELGLKKKPKIVIFIDELADLMLVAAKEVEEAICRVAQMGRAAGIHLVIATQRPSSDVITGLMKANIPSRIALAVASSLDSRIILDVSGAEDLVGNGDMLFAPLGKTKRRVQGCYISDKEVNDVIEAIKRSSAANYDENIQNQVNENAIKNERNNKGGASAMNVAPPESSTSQPEDERDALFNEAVDVVVELQMASASTLQRKLKIGYARAARLIDQLEQFGYIGEFEGSKPRKVLVSKERWAEKKMQGGAMTALDEGLRLAKTMSADADADLPPF